MGRPSLPLEMQKKITELAASGMGERAIGRALNLARTSVFNFLNPRVAKQRRDKYKKKKYSAKLIAMDRMELPDDNFDVYRNGKEDWLTG